MFVSLRTVLFRLHWALGLTAGLVLALVGVTGAMMSYEEAILDLANADRAQVAVQDRPVLGPEALVARLSAERPGLRVGALTFFGDPALAPRARFADDAKAGDVKPGGRAPSVYLDPYDGTLRGEVRGEATFATIRGLHRLLLLPGEGRGWGRTITGAAALALLVFLATGLVLRWPKVHAWRIWLKPSLRRPGRPRYWSLHAVAGTWLLPVYAVIALTGLWWSYDAYKSAATWLLTGEVAVKGANKPAEARADRVGGRKSAERTDKSAERTDKSAERTDKGAERTDKGAERTDKGAERTDKGAERTDKGAERTDKGAERTDKGADAPPALDKAWAAFRAEEGASAALATVTPPGPDAARIRIRWIAEADAPKARNESIFDAATGGRLSLSRFSDKPLGRQIADSMLEVHRGRYFGAAFALVFCLAALAMPPLAVTGLVLYVLRRRAGAARGSVLRRAGGGSRPDGTGAMPGNAPT
ncbi:PepSY domain-containing protein [Methylobacterium sp. WL12]|uniref:PepSY-associated TM helix domain-containing protein n=1 Tax=Methylobacterium sp. WL12 TaxID=2603890 RepID=UPI0011C924D0|nr:PepSY-associated TM helix domain-containing protein [Methylobacterium sp. WL12]TXM72581.1 PepSY domain-containing protein [Methylobacterium sp. WL12]